MRALVSSAITIGIVSSIVFCSALQAQASDDNSAAQQLADTQSRTAQAQADAALATARKALIDARIAELGLPKFNGTTEFKAEGGKLEAAMLSTTALGNAARYIAASVRKAEQIEHRSNTDASGDGKAPANSKVVPAKQYFVLEGAEPLDFGDVAVLRTEMGAVHSLFDTAGVYGRDSLKSLGVTTAIAAFSAAAGLLRADTEVSAVDLSSTITDRSLAIAVASALGSGAIFPSALLIIDEGKVAPETYGGTLIDRMTYLAGANGKAIAMRAAYGPKPDAGEADEAARLDRAIARYAALLDRTTKPNAAGQTLLSSAARSEKLMEMAPDILRVHVNQAAGSFVNTKNIATTFGVDPVKVSGGVIVSYTITRPRTGAIIAADVITCRTTLASLRKIQEANWKPKEDTGSGACRGIKTE